MRLLKLGSAVESLVQDERAERPPNKIPNPSNPAATTSNNSNNTGSACPVKGSVKGPCGVNSTGGTVACGVMSVPGAGVWVGPDGTLGVGVGVLASR
jgi:hypothetical protein